MAEFRMPALGAEMESGTLVEWKVKPGDAVKRGDIVAVVDTNKGAIEIEIWQDGIVEDILAPLGAKVPFGAVLARVRGPGEVPAAPPPAGPAPPVSRPSPAAVEVPPIAPAGQIVPRASPAARSLARELGVDLASVHGTGPGGAVTREDVAAAAATGRPAPPSPMRQAIAAAMARSKREIPHYYLAADIDLGRAMAWLATENLRRPVTERLLPVVLLLKAVARAVRKVPELNGFWVDGSFRASEAVHLGMAISLRQGGLVAPALHDADRGSLDELTRDVNDLVARARGGGLRSSELADSTLTVTSLGDLGVATIFGVIYPPQVALVGFGKVAERPWVVDGRIEPRPVVTATLSADHRASDGQRGAQFLEEVDRLLQLPEEL